MKRLFRNKIISHGLCFVLGAIIFGSIGVVATNYLLKAEDVEYRDNKNLQDAIDELYGMAKKGGFETLPIGTVTKTYNSITIPYTGNYNAILCIYGAGNSNTYGSLGTINSNVCDIKGLQPKTSYDYKIISADSTGKVYEGHGTIETEEAPALEYYSNPSIVYFNPVTNTTCNNYTSSNSNTGTKTGCMKWYAYKLEGGNYSLLLDHNTTAGIAYNSNNSNASPTTIQPEINALTSTSGWVVTPRLISADEIAGIVGNTSWNSTSSTNWFYLDSKTTTQTAKSQGASAYAWLYDYTKNCTSNGCNTADSSNYGYWTSSKYSGNSNYVWYVLYNGTLNHYNASNTNSGLRPVITVSSSVLSLG